MRVSLLHIIGVLTLGLGILTRVWPAFDASEKPGVYYAFGHNIDVAEASLPLLILGAGITGLGFLVARRKRDER